MRESERVPVFLFQKNSDMRYVANKYAGGTWCGNGYFQTMEECLEFAMDGFCDYVRVKDLTTGVTFKIHFDGQEF